MLLLLAFAPVALVAAAIPGRGHDFFKGWLEKLAGYLLRKAAYSLILAILLAVNGALASATSQLGWLMSFGLQALFFWAVFLQRKTLADSLIGIATGPRAPGRDGPRCGCSSLYAGARIAGALRAPLRRGGPLGGGAPGRLLGGGGRAGGGGRRPSGPRRAAPRFGTSYSRPGRRRRACARPPAPAERARPARRGRRDARHVRGVPRPRAECARGPAQPASEARPRKATGKRKRPTASRRRPSSAPQRPARTEKPARNGPAGQRQPPRRESRPPQRSQRNRAGKESGLGAELRAERERSAKAGRRRRRPERALEPGGCPRRRGAGAGGGKGGGRVSRRRRGALAAGCSAASRRPRGRGRRRDRRR